MKKKSEFLAKTKSSLLLYVQLLNFCSATHSSQPCKQIIASGNNKNYIKNYRLLTACVWDGSDAICLSQRK